MEQFYNILTLNGFTGIIANRFRRVVRWQNLLLLLLFLISRQKKMQHLFTYTASGVEQIASESRRNKCESYSVEMARYAWYYQLHWWEWETKRHTKKSIAQNSVNRWILKCVSIYNRMRLCCMRNNNEKKRSTDISFNAHLISTSFAVVHSIYAQLIPRFFFLSQHFLYIHLIKRIVERYNKFVK